MFFTHYWSLRALHSYYKNSGTLSYKHTGYNIITIFVALLEAQFFSYDEIQLIWQP